jgi:UTP:GlnB (protein PII) uridylyltransferase
MVNNIILLRDNLKSAQRKPSGFNAITSGCTTGKALQSVDQTLLQSGNISKSPECSLIAVGGYGRGELFPHSDVDVLILLPSPDKTTAGKLENLMQLFWDIGLDIGHSVRTVEECLRKQRDITIQTSMLEARYICGSRSLFRDLQQCYAEAMNPQKFFRKSCWKCSGMSNTKTRLTVWSRIARKARAVADLQVISGLPKQPISATHGMNWQFAV